MDKDAYIKRLEAEVAKIPAMQKYIETLEKRIEQMQKHIDNLERRLGRNLQNSSKPPSSDPPGTALMVPRRLHRKRGARKGHPHHLRALLPPERVTHRIERKPEACPCGGTHFEKTNDPPRRHQIVDLPPIVPDVVEYVQAFYRCRDCGAAVYQPLPGDVKRRHFGPGVLSMVGILTGMLNTSKRKALAVI